jgi:hypothetical protein
VAYRAGGTVQTQLTWFDRSGRAVGTFDARDVRVPEILTTLFPEILITSLPRSLAA